MNAFEKHGISHLSPSSLALWSEHPGLWVLRYLGGFKDEGGPAMWRGKAVEDGLTAIMHGKDGLSVALSTFEANAKGELSDDIDKERALVPLMLKQAAQFEPTAPLIAVQLKVEHWFDGIDVPFMGYIDYLFEDCILDLKTTQRCPSEPKPSHIRQVALYSAAKDRPSALLYVTDKKRAHYPIGGEDSAKALDEMRGMALSLEAFLSRMDSANDALHCLPINADDFRVNESMLHAHAQLLGG